MSERTDDAGRIIGLLEELLEVLLRIERTLKERA